MLDAVMARRNVIWMSIEFVIGILIIDLSKKKKAIDKNSKQIKLHRSRSFTREYRRQIFEQLTNGPQFENSQQLCK